MCAFVSIKEKTNNLTLLFDFIKSLELVVPIPQPMSWSARQAMQSPQSAKTPTLLTLKRPPILLVEWIFISYWRNLEKTANKNKRSFFLLTILLYQTFLSSQYIMKYSLIRRPMGQFAVKTFLNGFKKHFFYFSDCFLSYQTRSGRWLWRYLPKIRKRWFNLRKYFQFSLITNKWPKPQSLVYLRWF